MTIQLLQGDITRAEVDAIVNAANPSLLGGGGVDGAIHRAAGPELLAACRAIPAIDGERCATGQARITPGFQLPARYVIHTVGPVYQHSANPAQSLRDAYTNSLRLALANQCQTVALPAISCGVFGYPWQEAAEIALAVACEPEFAELVLSFYLFDAELFRVWQQVLSER
ncbi:O-acetyl-ADP-ribose deacetylase [Halioxenophilus sp. WMMB6]|uniref:O-acetyl-ADP-ribose deacetylase n=1 Tax=Halioxenophilus sp. WMMB6 TaxID=3073815 RepID=UPI00295F0044|nr:O-acetyl-ADP-ribose deacetylase [Halioxenophilus sp. WMMB6]